MATPCLRYGNWPSLGHQEHWDSDNNFNFPYIYNSFLLELYISESRIINRGKYQNNPCIVPDVPIMTTFPYKENNPSYFFQNKHSR